MARDLTHTITYPKPMARAWSDLCDPAFHEAKLADAGARNAQVSVAVADDGTAEVVLERDNPVTGLPSAVTRIIGDSAHVIERISWSAPQDPDGHRVAQHVTEFVGAPLSMTGTLTLAPAGEVTTLTLATVVRASVPLVGGKLEQSAVDQTVHAMHAEEAFSGRWPG